MSPYDRLPRWAVPVIIVFGSIVVVVATTKLYGSFSAWQLARHRAGFPPGETPEEQYAKGIITAEDADELNKKPPRLQGILEFLRLRKALPRSREGTNEQASPVPV